MFVFGYIVGFVTCFVVLMAISVHHERKIERLRDRILLKDYGKTG
jgi:hypothetical protein